jgi:hypothetical protein
MENLIDEDGIKLHAISGFTIIVTDEKLHLFIVIHKIVNRRRSDVQGTGIVDFSLQETAMPWPKERNNEHLFM